MVNPFKYFSKNFFSKYFPFKYFQTDEETTEETPPKKMSGGGVPDRLPLPRYDEDEDVEIKIFIGVACLSYVNTPKISTYDLQIVDDNTPKISTYDLQIVDDKVFVNDDSEAIEIIDIVNKLLYTEKFNNTTEDDEEALSMILSQLL